MQAKLEPIGAAKTFVRTHFSNCQAALLAGSIVRGEATATSDLDIIIFDDTLVSSYRNRSSSPDGISSCSPIT
jgi:predicted nucleotidyltransferase